MTEAQLDLAHKLVGDIGHCVHAMEQYGNARIADTMRNAASLLQAMIDEYELVKAQEALEIAKARRDKRDEPTTMGGIDRSPSAVYRTGLTGGDDHG